MVTQRGFSSVYAIIDVRRQTENMAANEKALNGSEFKDKQRQGYNTPCEQS